MDPWLSTYIEQYKALCPLCRAPLHPQCHECLRCRRKFQLGAKVLQAYLIAWGIAVCMLALESGIGAILLYVAVYRGGIRHLRDEQLVYVGIGVMGILT